MTLMKGLTLDRRATFFFPIDLVTFKGYLEFQRLLDEGA